MTNTVVSLICNPAEPGLTTSIVQRVCSIIDPLVGVAGQTVLADGVAADIKIKDGANVSTALETVREALRDQGIDVNSLSTEGRRKSLLIADMDSTIIQQECIDELADFAGLKPEIAAITERAMRGELDFEAALLERVGKLKGLSEETLLETFETRLTLTPGAKELVQTMNAAGALTALVSGGFTYFTARVAAAAGFQKNRANELLLENGALTGDVARPILGKEAKRKALDQFTVEQKINPADALAVGDGANDLAMIEKAGLGVAFHAKPAVAEKADAVINHGDLTALLYLQGYSASEFNFSSV